MREMIISYDVPEENQINTIVDFARELGYINVFILSGEITTLLFVAEEYYDELKPLLELLKKSIYKKEN